MEETGYAASLRAQGFEGETRLENIEEFVSNVVRYEQTAEEPSLQEFLEEIALITDIDNFDREADSVVPVSYTHLASCGVKPSMVAPMKVKKIPPWAAAPSRKLLGLAMRGPKSVIQPMPRKMSGG